MISIHKLLGDGDRVFDFLEDTALEAQTSIKVLRRHLANPRAVKNLDEFPTGPRKDNAVAAQISEALSTTFITPLERADIEGLALALCKIQKTVRNIAERIMLAPQFLDGIDLASHLALMEKAGEAVVIMIKELRHGDHLDRIGMHNDQLDAIASDADKKLLQLLASIYKRPVEVVKALFLKDIAELLEEGFDCCHDAGDVINRIVRKDS